MSFCFRHAPLNHIVLSTSLELGNESTVTQQRTRDRHNKDLDSTTAPSARSCSRHGLRSRIRVVRRDYRAGDDEGRRFKPLSSLNADISIKTANSALLYPDGLYIYL